MGERRRGTKAVKFEGSNTTRVNREVGWRRSRDDGNGGGQSCGGDTDDSDAGHSDLDSSRDHDHDQSPGSRDSGLAPHSLLSSDVSLLVNISRLLLSQASGHKV